MSRQSSSQRLVVNQSRSPSTSGVQPELAAEATPPEHGARERQQDDGSDEDAPEGHLAGSQLLHGDRVGEVVGAAAPVLLGVGHAHQTELAELLDDLVGEAVLAVELLRDRSHLLLGEVAHEALNVSLLVCEIEIQGRDCTYRG